jgi:chaperone required for assembly of F1-ATPase
VKRFWREAASGRQGTGWIITLDGKPMRLPGGGELWLPQQRLAQAIAAEWQCAGARKNGEIATDELPLTQLAATTRHRIAPAPGATAAAIAKYAEADCLCYRVEHPPELALRQNEKWQPWLDWAAETFDARLIATTGIEPVPQPTQALHALAAAVSAHDAWQLAGLGVLVPAYGSVVLGLAVVAGALTADAALRLSLLEELHEEELWGADDLAVTRRARMAREVADAARFVQLAANKEAPF